MKAETRLCTVDVGFERRRGTVIKHDGEAGTLPNWICTSLSWFAIGLGSHNPLIYLPTNPHFTQFFEM